MRTIGKSAVTVSLLLAASAAGTASAEDAKPAGTAAPALSDILTSSGITATGYVDGTYSYVSASPPTGSSVDTNTFALNQASLTLGYLPTTGFGALVNAVAGTEAGNGCYAPGYLPCGTAGSTSSFNLLQAYVQYVDGKSTVLLGKFTTLAGAEVAAPTGDVNVTRSLLFWYMEPVTHVGARLTYAASGKVSVTVGANNGWNVDGTSAKGGKTAEVGVTLTASKTFSLTAAGYYGDFDFQFDPVTVVIGKRALIDVVGTWTATPALTVIVNTDWDQQGNAGGTGTGSASWYGVAGYLNYAINSAWRTSFRAEFMEDKDGFATGTGVKTKVDEGTLTFGYMPSKNFEFRFEGRYDTYKPDSGGDVKLTQAWLQALYKF